MRLSLSIFVLATAVACASAAVELRCSSGVLQGVGGSLGASVYSTKTGVQRPVDCASACAASKDCRSYQYCGYGSFNGTCAFVPERKDGKDVTPTPAFASKGDCMLSNGTSWRQAPSKPEYGGWTFGIGCTAAQVADPVVSEEKDGGAVAAAPARAPAVSTAASPRTTTAAAEPDAAATAAETISPLRKPTNAKAAAPAVIDAGAADPNAPVVVPAAAAAAAAPASKTATATTTKAPPAAAAAAAAEPAKPAGKTAAAAAAAAEPAKPAGKTAAAATAAAPSSAMKPAAASTKAAAPAAAPVAPPADAPVGPAGPGSLSAPIRGYVSGRLQVGELQGGIESAAECASLCAAAEKSSASSSCSAYSWCAAVDGCPGGIAPKVCQLWGGKAGSGKLAPNDSGWVSAVREAAPAPMKVASSDVSA